jgi:hypothetical protein
MSHSADFELLIARVQRRVGASASKEELEALFELGDDAYIKDSPKSVNKHLRILSIQFSGAKNTGEVVEYERFPSSGVNLWIGENLVGKSSIFKLVKLAITGRKSVDKSIMKWIHELWVEFTLGYETYTVYIHRKSNNFVFNFYKLDREQLTAANEEEHKAARAYYGSMEGYAAFLEEFFFEQFSYYPMQWVAKSSQPEDPQSYINDTSWVTFFSTVYLAAEEYNKLLYGQQAKLIFQMLLGLELTIPINRLESERKLKIADLGLLNHSIPSGIEPEEVEELRQEIQRVNAEIRALTQEASAAAAPPSDEVSKKLEIASARYSATTQHAAQLRKEIGALTTLEAELSRQEGDCSRRIREYKATIVRKRKRARELQEYNELGAWFADLEVGTCPSCNHGIEQALVKKEKATGSCRLCNKEVAHQTAEPGTYEEEIATLNRQADELYQDQYTTKLTYDEAVEKRKRALAELQFKEETLSLLSPDRILAEIDALQQQAIVKPATLNVMQHMQRTAELAVRKHKIDEQLKAYTQPNAAIVTRQQKLKQQISLLSAGIQELELMRQERSTTLLQRLADLYLEQLHAFGLDDYSRIIIDDKFKISYEKLEEEYSFEELTAGEQLRAKIGLYIALIQMDVQDHYGRHPRLIILDSPAKEEADTGFIEGLKQMLTYIEENMADELQVFVGTTVRTLASAVDSDKIDERGKPDGFGSENFF